MRVSAGQVHQNLKDVRLTTDFSIGVSASEQERNYSLSSCRVTTFEDAWA